MERIEKRIAVVVIGLPGRASSMVAEAVTRQRDMKLLGFTLGNYAERFKINGMEIVQLEPYLHRRKLAEERPDVVVDLTPRRETARFRYNVELCSECGIFVIAGDNRSGVVRKLRVSAATIPDVFSGKCDLIVPLVLEAIRKLFRNKGQRKALFHFHDLMEAIAT